ncbi:MAG: NADH-quinone oxidoreductase subunit H, partial [Verrucomicrobiales bacterium]|nr:NADH-quinone oxidoreductase subunit H [Verrucomicrobiales bacterium]
MDLALFITSAIKIVMIAFVTLLPMVAYAGWAERRFAAIIQDRVGPNRTGIPLTLFGGKKDLPFAGLLQPMADGLKFILKEDFTPKHVRTFYYWLAPCLTLVPAFLMVAVVPFGSNLHIPFTEITVPVVIADLNIGPLWIFAVSSIGVYGIVLAGYGSNSKYPFLGGIRASSQMISYEIALGLSVVPVLMVFGELNLGEIVRYQDAHGWLLAPFWGDGVSLQRWV